MKKPDFNIYESRSLTNHYVFYERLKTDYDGARLNLYNSIDNRLKDFTTNFSRIEKVGRNMIAFANQELDKEVKFLSSIFKEKIPIRLSYKDPTALTTILDAFNHTMNLKENYQRNITRIKAFPKLQINIASFVDTYMAEAWAKEKAQLIRNLGKIYENALASGLNVDDEISKAVADTMDKAMQRAMIDMFSSQTFKNSDTGKEDYQKLLEDFQSYSSQSNWLLENLRQVYKVDEIIAKIQQEIRNEVTIAQKKKKLSSKSYKKEIQEQFSNNRYQRGGLSLEFLENYIVDLVVKSNTDGSISFQGHHTGASGAKADNVYTFNLNGINLEPDFEELNQIAVNRENLTTVFKDFNSQIEEIDDGWIVYSSAKNYTSQEDNSFKGFSAGDPVQAEKMGKIIGDPAKIGAIYQTIDGAIGANRDDLWESIRVSLAADIAYFLFDDFYAKNRGKNITTSNSLHVFDLDGIFVPLSLLLYRLGNAMVQTAKMPTSIISVEITKPDKILYPKIEMIQDQYGWHDAHAGQFYWDKQREEAQAHTTIAFHFFKDFFRMIRENF